MGLGLFHGFSKVLIGLGLEPEQMDTTVLPTPEFTTELPDVDLTDRHTMLLAAHLDLAARWKVLWDELHNVTALEPAVLAACRARVATLHGQTWATEPADVEPASSVDLVEAAVAVAELFVIDVRALTDAQVAAVANHVGDAGVSQLFIGLAVWDGIYRVAATASSRNAS